MTWAIKYSGWTVDDFSKVYYSDESLISCKKQGIMWVRKGKNEPYTQEMINCVKKFNGGL